MDVKEFKRMEGEEISPVKKTMNGVLTGFLSGGLMGVAVAGAVAAHRGQPLELIRALKTVGIIGASSVAIAGLYMGTEQLMQKQGMKRNHINYAVGGLISGGLVIGFYGKTIPVCMGVLAATQAFFIIRSGDFETGGLKR